MSRVNAIALKCANCRAHLRIHEGTSITDCSYCGVQHVIVWNGREPHAAEQTTETRQHRGTLTDIFDPIGLWH